ncbi:hypothetical protein FNV43_RR07293 [Rhamnella rubrinervis]|uniref:Uncharacterized protein n=1 Tax=Rhamnella rubrinervis TaxID=2594499 RepID=A0A8K0HG87_9ROSA|nr:hypothetical protein FNV43_RR07293 [Rhamnella rubrinervis]
MSSTLCTAIDGARKQDRKTKEDQRNRDRVAGDGFSFQLRGLRQQEGGLRPVRWSETSEAESVSRWGVDDTACYWPIGKGMAVAMTATVLGVATEETRLKNFS